MSKSGHNPEYSLYPGKRKCPKNGPEGMLYRKLEKRGYEVHKRGWPDFNIWSRKGRLCCVEVKPANHRLKLQQYRILTALASYGVPCYIWRPVRGFSKVLPDGTIVDVPDIEI